MFRSGLLVCGFLLCAGASRADMLSFNYTLSGGTVLMGTFQGTLQGDLNTFIVTSVGAVKFNGISSPALPYVESFEEYALGGAALSPTVTKDGSFLDVAACTASDCLEGFFLLVNSGASPFFGGDSYIGGPSFGGVQEPYVRANWSATTDQSTVIPEPATGGLMVAGLAAFLLGRRRFSRG